MTEQLKLLNSNTTLMWLRRDLRLNDNAALYHALKVNKDVLPVFIFDTQILNRLENKEDRRIAFIHQTLQSLKLELEKLGSSLCVLHGDPVEIIRSISPKAVYANHDYAPYGLNRDQKVNQLLTAKGIPFKTHKDQVIFEKREITKDDGKPYTIFTPYSRKWKATVTPFHLKGYPTEKYFSNLKKVKPLSFLRIEDIGFKNMQCEFPENVIHQGLIEKYDKVRNYPAIKGTTRLSVHLRFGTVSIRRLASLAIRKNETWLNELIWRDFYQMILWHFPSIEKQAFKSVYDQIAWINNESDFKKWCEGKTGYPLVDAGMRELNATGFMHNRVRMVVASFLTKHLLIDWRWGESYFAEKLLDFDLASNNGGWQWAVGSGCDAAPYFRIFNPETQREKFDPKSIYVKMWLPEYGTKDYPAPMVDHKMARERALKAYSKALKQIDSN